MRLNISKSWIVCVVAVLGFTASSIAAAAPVAAVAPSAPVAMQAEKLGPENVDGSNQPSLQRGQRRHGPHDRL